MLVLAALADPVRRAIVELLVDGEVSAGEIADRFPVSRPAVSRHLRVLREAGLVRSSVRGQQRVYALESTAFTELERWLERVRPPMNGPAARLDALGTELHRGRRQRRATATEGDPDARSTG